MKTLKKQIKWRRDKKALFIRDCKNSLDLKLPLENEPFLKKLFCGVNFEELDETEKLIFLEFEKLGFLADLELRELSSENFSQGMDILDSELKVERIRDSDFLKNKFEKCPEFFIGIYLESEIVGIICGFHRDDYLLISEIAVDSRFQKRNFGKKLVMKFEEVGFKKYDKINVGALDNSIEFYKSLGYNPFLLIQFEKGVYCEGDFSNFEVINSSDSSVELKIKNCNLGELQRLRNIYQKANLQYIFVKRVSKS